MEMEEQQPKFVFRTDASVQSFSVPSETYIKSHPLVFDGEPVLLIGVSAYVIDAGTRAHVESPPPGILLIQRAASDSRPNLWEVPGGACDAEDASVLHSCARELWEEAGLVATEIGPVVAYRGQPDVFRGSRSGKLFAKFGFLVKTAGATRLPPPSEADKEGAGGPGGGQISVRLDPKEHQNHVWASEEEVKNDRVGDLKLAFTSQRQKELILEAFGVWRRTALS